VFGSHSRLASDEDSARLRIVVSLIKLTHYTRSAADRGIGVASSLRTPGAPESTPVDPMSKWLWCLCKVVTVFSTGLIPYLSRMTSETEGVATGNDRKLNPQVSVPFPPLALVTDSARTTLSRWRHGFEPRWDYKQRCRSEGMFRLSIESAGPFVPHLSRGRPRHVTTEPAEKGVRVVSVADFFVFRRRLALPRS
jgi:hypothetical protein